MEKKKTNVLLFWYQIKAYQKKKSTLKLREQKQWVAVIFKDRKKVLDNLISFNKVTIKWNTQNSFEEEK